MEWTTFDMKAMVHSEPSCEDEMEALSQEIRDICENERSRLQKDFYDFRADLQEELNQHLTILKSTNPRDKGARERKMGHFQCVLAQESGKYELLLIEIQKKEHGLLEAARDYCLFS